MRRKIIINRVATLTYLTKSLLLPSTLPSLKYMDTTFHITHRLVTWCMQRCLLFASTTAARSHWLRFSFWTGSVPNKELDCLLPCYSAAANAELHRSIRSHCSHKQAQEHTSLSSAWFAASLSPPSISTAYSLVVYTSPVSFPLHRSQDMNPSSTL